MSKAARSDKEKTTRALLLLLLLCSFSVTFNLSQATSSLPVHNLDTGLDYETIYEAIDAPETLEGHTIQVDAGTYHERISIYKDNLTILGENPESTIIDSGGIGDVVYITADGIQLNGFTIRGGGRAGIYIDYASYNTFFGNKITDNSEYGIYADHSDNNTILQNTFSNNWHGILFWYSSNSLIHRNNFVNNLVQVHTEMSINIWDNGYPSGGNYWSDYTGVDMDGDGIGDTPYIIDEDNQDRYPLMNPWIVPHDIAITDVTAPKTIIGQGLILPLNVTISNQGDYTETFDATAYANSISIQTKTITLTSGDSTTVTYTWDTSGFSKGNYIISAEVPPVPGEIDTEDNTFIADGITVAMMGDVIGPLGAPDGKVDIRDIAAIAMGYGTYLGHPSYEPNHDINYDGKIDIKDIAQTALRYGLIDP